MNIRMATLADVYALRDMIERAYRGDSARKGWTHEADLLEGQRTDVAALTDLINDPAQQILIATDQDHITGCVQITSKADGIAYLGLLSVDPEIQANGLGKSLIAAAEALAQQEFGATVMEMTVIGQRAELIAYYERRGYALTGERRPFPMDDERFGLPVIRDLSFVVLAKPLHP
jgi:predicted N-acetyltransferase YhbS